MQAIRRTALVSLMLAACGSPSPEVPSSPEASTITVEPEGSQASTMVERIEVRLDGKYIHHVDGAVLPVHALMLTPGDHAIELRVIVSGKADPTGNVTSWSSTEKLRVGSTATKVEVRFFVAPDARPIAKRLEARYRATGAEVLGGSLPVVRSAGSKIEAIALEDGTSEERVQALISNMRTASGEAGGRLWTAQAMGNEVALSCVNEKLDEMRRGIDAAEDRAAELHAANIRGDRAAAVQAGEAVEAIRKHQEQLYVAADGCIPHPILPIDETTTE